MSRAPLSPRSEYRCWTQVSTRWHDNDVYGHVNNAVYYGWFDTAVNEFLIENDLLDFAGNDLIGLVVESGCRYAAPLAFPQTIEIGLRIGKIGTSSVTYQLGAYAKGSEGAAAECRFTHVYVDRETRRPAPLPPVWRAILNELI
ncbi:MAG: acyl-CoA thioesterase [Sphingomonadaceae bacterium]|nr:acyl-CoA thioesterase [Sphingobium sp.]MBP9159018.1 acyl-CoA thioesterase [Sphingobium sp.]MCC6481363.1 acyl-CoA thioesterase [Sphingomonadaceae bacterium]